MIASRSVCILLVVAALLMAGVSASTDGHRDASAAGKRAEFWPFTSSDDTPKVIGTVVNVGGTTISSGHTKVMASACPAGYRTALKRFQVTALLPVSIKWSINPTPLAKSTTGFASHPQLSSGFSVGPSSRIVFSVRCLSSSQSCEANIEGEFTCSRGTTDQKVAGFGAFGLIVYSDVDKQVRLWKTITPSESLLQVSASPTLEKLKAKIEQANEN